MDWIVEGNRTTYGHQVGILMSDSISPRIPGDPGHAETFNFPVTYGVLKNFPFQDLVEIKKDNIDILINASLSLQAQGVKLIAADCGLFAPYQEEMKNELSVPFIGSALDMIPLLDKFLPHGSPIGILTGDTGILSPQHLGYSGIADDQCIIYGMEESREFQKVVINRHPELNVDNMRKDVCQVAMRFRDHNIGALVIECTNLIPFGKDIQNIVGVPVYDLVSLIEFHISGFRKKSFSSAFIDNK